MEDANIETELKLWVDDLSAVEAKLVELGATLHAPRVLEKNLRYDLPDGSMTDDGIVLRLRQDSRVRLTYKEPGTLQDGIMSRFEAEVEVSDFKTMSLILERLGYVCSFAYEKYRTTYHLMESEVTLDEMPFGTFVEIEGNRDSIHNAMSALGLANAARIRMGYSTVFAVLRERLNLPFPDATFQNFEAVVLPGSVKSLLI